MRNQFAGEGVEIPHGGLLGGHPKSGQVGRLAGDLGNGAGDGSILQIEAA